MLRALRDHYLRIDARSLGLFRVLFGLVLIGDLFRRWAWSSAFYSNEGVLPNHNHLFNLLKTGRVWSVLHAFSSPGEAHFAFGCFLVVYVFFTVGWHTRAFHALSLAALVSLNARNILTENAGTYASIAVLAFTLFLPCGRRFSFDALRASMKAREEKHAADLADRAWMTNPETPTSLAALGLLLQLSIIFAVTALQQKGATWNDGTALHYALHVDRWASDLGVWLRGAAPAGLLRVWGSALHLSGWAIPALVVVPVLPRYTRAVAAGLMLFHGLTLGLFFDLGPYGWTLAAAAPLVLTDAWWQAAARKGHRQARNRTVLYDSDCGVCLWIARLLVRLDRLDHLTLRGNDEVGSEGATFPKEVTRELADATVIVIDGEGHVFTRGRAVAEAIAALPLGRPVSWLMRAPGIAQLLDLAYDRFAPRRQRVSELMGLASCGIPIADEPGDEPGPTAPSPARRLAGTVLAGGRELAALAVVAAMLVQTGRKNELPASLTLSPNDRLEAIATWPRMIGRWDVFVPAPPVEDALMVTGGQPRGGKSVDVLTGLEPSFDLSSRPAHLGQLWGDYLDRIHQKEWNDFQKAFRDYVVKGGPAWDTKQPDANITGLDAYWVTQPSPAPGQRQTDAPSEKEKIFTHSRGGRLGLDKFPAIRPERRP